MFCRSFYHFFTIRKILGEKLNQMISEKEELQKTINNLNQIVASKDTFTQDREKKLLQEIESLKSYAATYSRESFETVLEENRRYLLLDENNFQVSVKNFKSSDSFI